MKDKLVILLLLRLESHCRCAWVAVSGSGNSRGSGSLSLGHFRVSGDQRRVSPAEESFHSGALFPFLAFQNRLPPVRLHARQDSARVPKAAVR
jgi:hypothetical protein